MSTPNHVPRLILQGTFTAQGDRVLSVTDAIHRLRPASFGPPLASSCFGSRPQAWAPPELVRDGAPGRALDTQTRREMESLYGESFATVSIHHSPTVRSLGARAVTLGERIYFGPGEYQPLTPSGAALLCRELSHVSQQRQLAPMRRCDGIPIVHDPWLEAEASRRGLDLALQRRTLDGRAPTLQRMSTLTIGLIAGGVFFGTIGLIALTRYLASRWSRQGGPPALRDNPANTMDPFELAWNVTQGNSLVVQPPLGAVLIISESGPEKERTGRLLTKADSIIRTYYNGEWWFRKKQNLDTLDQTWLPWNWVVEDFPGTQTFDTIIARSMICACDDDHFEGKKGPFAGEAISTCGGIGADARVDVLMRVLGLLRAGGRAVFTVSRQGGGIPEKVRAKARARSQEYWRSALQTLSKFCRCVELYVPDDGHGGEPKGDFFGFVLYRDGRVKRD